MYGLAATTSNYISFTVTIYYAIIIYIIMTVHSKSFLSNRWHQIDKEWAAKLVGLHMFVRGSFWNGCTEEEKGSFYRGKIKEYNHGLRRWLIEFDNDDEDQHMRYDAVLRYADADAGTFHNFKLPANPIPPPQKM